MDIEKILSPHFKLKEFLKNGSLAEVTPEILANLTRLAQRLEQAREICGNRPLRINSGFRTKAHNQAVGGAPNSYHRKGLAADFIVAGMSTPEARYLLRDWDGGLELDTSWIHLDLGPKRRFKP
jgi:uncharacterized protein YcbK (DUF882 family)